MKTRNVLSVMIVTILIYWVMPESSFCQVGVRLKRSNELTRSALRLINEKKLDNAKDQLNQAIRLNPKNVMAHELKALIFYQEHNYPVAKKQAKIAIELNKKSPRALFVLGMINFEQGNQDLARSQLTLGIESLKEPEYRLRAKNILEKLKDNVDEKRPLNIRKSLPPKDELTKPLSLVADYKPFLAVFPFEDTNARTEQTKIGQTLTEMLITAMINANRYNVMERVQLENILKEQSLSQTGVIDTETAVEVGKLSGLEGVIVGSISLLKSSIEADARLIEVETGKALAAASANVNNVDNIRELANNLARQLSTKAHLIAPETDSTEVKNQ